MEKITDQTLQDAIGLNRLMPNLADQQRIESSVVHAEKKGEKRTRSNSESRIRAHLLRLTRLLEHEGVEVRVWNSAVEELVIDADEIPESYWEQQIQIARDNGFGDIDLGRHERDQLTIQIQEAQRTGLESWREYLETTGDQYPLWFKFYVWDGMSHLGTFNKQKGHYNKRSRGTVAPYPQLNPAALAKVFEAVKNKGVDDLEVAQLVKSGNFNKLYSHMLLDQKVIIPTPERPEDVHGEWREYTREDIQAITEAAQGTPWCIAGRDMAMSYTKNGDRFLLFHLQDPETGKVSPTAAASVRLDVHGQVAEISGLKGGSSQFVEDALVPTIQAKVEGLSGGERYLQAFEDKQMLISMDRKFQNGEPFSLEELIFLYEVDRPIEYIDSYAKDPRIKQFKGDEQQHIQQIAEAKGISIKDAELFIWTSKYIRTHLDDLLSSGYNPTTIAIKLLETGHAIPIILNLDKFSGLDHNIVVNSILDSGNGFELSYVVDYLGKFQSLDSSIAFKLIDFLGEDPGVVLANIDKFHGLNHQQLVNYIMENRRHYYADYCSRIAEYLERLHGVDHQELANSLLNSGLNNKNAFLTNLYKFKNLDQTTALELIETGHGNAVLDHLDIFQELDLEKIVKLIIENDYSGISYALEKNISKFQDFSPETLERVHWLINARW